MKIHTEKGDHCPICTRLILYPNVWVRFHVKYNPEMVVLACRYCNYVEKCLRCELPTPFSIRSGHRPWRKSRTECVVDFMERFGVKY